MIWAPVELGGMSGAESGLTGMTKAVTDKVLYTAGDTVSWRRPRVPQPRMDWTEAAFELSFKLTLANGVICWSPNDGWDCWEWITIHNLVDDSWHGDRLVLSTDNTSKIARRH